MSSIYIWSKAPRPKGEGQKWRNLTSSARPLSAHLSFEVTDRAEENNVRGLAPNVKPFLASLSVYGKITEGLTPV